MTSPTLPPSSQYSVHDSLAVTTWRWCDDFVVANHLCPWAYASVNTPNALHIYIVPQAQDAMYNGPDDSWSEAVTAAGRHMQERLAKGKCTSQADMTDTRRCTHADPQTSISFVVFEDSERDFESFYDWYLELEDEYVLNAERDESDRSDDHDPDHPGRVLTLAPFHPCWRYAEDIDSDAEDGESYDSDEEDGLLYTAYDSDGNDVDSGDESDSSSDSDNDEDAVASFMIHINSNIAQGEMQSSSQSTLDTSVSLEKQSPHPTVSLVASSVIDMAGPQATARIALDNQRCLMTQSMSEWRRLYNEAVYGAWQ
jgi:hypothetical protein